MPDDADVDQANPEVSSRKSWWPFNTVGKKSSTATISSLENIDSDPPEAEIHEVPWWHEAESLKMKKRSWRLSWAAGRRGSGQEPESIAGSKAGATLVGARVNILWNKTKNTFHRGWVRSYDLSSGTQLHPLVHHHILSPRLLLTLCSRTKSS